MFVRVAVLVLVASSVVLGDGVLALGDSSTSRISTTSSCGLVHAGATRVLSSSAPCLVATLLGASFQATLPSGFRWSAVRSSTDALRVREPGPRAATGGRVSVVARLLGRATLTSTGTMVCAVGVACPALARLWSLRVLVVATAHSPLTLLLSQDDAGRVMTLRVGDRLVLALARSTLYLWSAPISSMPVVLAPVNSSGGDIARATFIAREPGSAVLNVSETPRCYPECLMPSRLVRVNVVVVR